MSTEQRSSRNQRTSSAAAARVLDAGGPPVIFPGEETNVIFNFLFLALLTWSCFAAELYYAYYALERAESAGRMAVARKTQEHDEVL